MSAPVSVNENNESSNLSHKKSSSSSSSSKESIPDSSTNCSTIDSSEPIPERFIQLIDHRKPPCDASGPAGTAEADGQLLDDNDVAVYLLDASTEDPFTLESFDALIQQHAEKEKDFILARVTTSDSSDESKIYQSYYSAHHINKVLFRTQPDQGLLHRMKAKNPLNNMNIIGDVHYYLVKAESVKLTQQSFAKSSAMSIASHKTLHLNGDNVAMTEITATSALDKFDESYVINVGEDDRESSSRVNGPNSLSLSAGQFDHQTSDGMTLRRMANTLEKERRWSSGDMVQQPPRIFIPEYSLHIRRHQSMTGLHPSSRVLNSRKVDTRMSPTETTNNDKSIMSSLEEDKDSSIIKDGSTITTITTSSQSMKTHEKATSPSPTYNATFYATDDDFLMKSQVRQYFKANAIDPLDSQLFSINTSTQTSSATGALGIISPNPDDSLPTGIALNLAYRDSMLRANNGSRWSRPFRGFRMNKGVKWLVLMYMVFGILLIKFVVSATYVYLMAFLLMLCLFLVFCVGSGVCFWER